MGNSCTTLDNLTANDYLKRFCSAETLSENDPFWNSLFGFSLIDLDLVAMSSSNSKLLDDKIRSLCKNLAINNVKTGNFHTLVVYFVRRLGEVVAHEGSGGTEEINPFTWQVLNALFVIRCICKYFIQNLSEEVIIQQFLISTGSEAGGDKTISQFIESLVRGLTELPVHEKTVLLHLEIVNNFLTILAMAMYSTDMATNNVFYIEVMENQSSKRISAITQFLLTIYTHHDRLPSFVYKEEVSGSLSSTLWSVMTLGMAGGSTSDVRQVNLGIQSSLLLLVLTNHPSTANPYRKQLSTFMEESSLGRPLVKAEPVYNALCKDLQSEHAILLLYQLLHENQMMKGFVLSRTDIERLAEPLLIVLYSQDSETSSNHIYLTLITLLMLTEDDAFNKDLFHIRLPVVKWYKEKYLTDVTLGDMFILVTLKVMQFNMAHHKDKFLHTNCLAMLANMSSKFKDIHPYVCQRLLSFNSALVKRHSKTVEKLQLCKMKREAEGGEDEMDAAAGLLTDLGEMEEMLRMMFEIINSCITHAVQCNVHLVHVLLCHRMEFERLREFEQFKHILQNIHLLLEQFHRKLDNKFGEQTRSVAQVLEVIEKGLMTFRKGTFHRFPDLKYKYVEETDSANFFVPYVWQVVCNKSNLHFRPPNTL